MSTPSNPARLERAARASGVLDRVVRVGLVAYGVVHLLLALVAVRLVLGQHAGAATSQGALAQLADGTSGRLILGVLAVALVGLGVWQAIAAAVGYRRLSGVRRLLMRIGAAGRVVAYGYFSFVAGRLAVSGPPHPQSGSQSPTASLLASPAGALLLVALGLSVAITGVVLMVFGVRREFLDQLDQQARTADRRVLVVGLGQVGYVAKGLALAGIGGLLCWAAVTRDPARSRGFDRDLEMLLGHRFGGLVVLVAGLGLGCFGLYLFARSRHLSQESLTA